MLCGKWGEVRGSIEEALKFTDADLEEALRAADEDLAEAMRSSGGNMGATVRNFLKRILKENRHLSDCDDYSLPYIGMCYNQSLDERLDPKNRDGFEARVVAALGGAHTMRIRLCNTEGKRQADTMEAFAAAMLELASRLNCPGYRMLKRDGKGLNVVNCGIASFVRGKYFDMMIIVNHLIYKPAGVGEEPVMTSEYSILPARRYLTTHSDAVLDYAQTRDEFCHITRVEDVTYDLLHSFMGRRGYEAQVYAFMEENGIESFDEAASKLARKVVLGKFYNVGDLDGLTQEFCRALASASDVRGKIRAVLALLRENRLTEPVDVAIVSNCHSAFSEAGEESRFILSNAYGHQHNFSVAVSNSNAKERTMLEARALLDALSKDDAFKPSNQEMTIDHIRKVSMHILNRGRVLLINLEYELKTALKHAEVDSITNREERIEAKCDILQQIIRALPTELQNVAVSTEHKPPYRTKFKCSNDWVARCSVVVSVKPADAKEQTQLEARAILDVFAQDSDICSYLSSQSSQSAKAKAVRNLLEGVLNRSPVKVPVDADVIVLPPPANGAHYRKPEVVEILSQYTHKSSKERGAVVDLMIAKNFIPRPNGETKDATLKRAIRRLMEKHEKGLSIVDSEWGRVGRPRRRSDDEEA